MATAYELEHDVLTKVWRRNLTPDDALFSTAAGSNGLSVISGTLSVDRGHWVQLNASGKAVVASAAASARGAMPVWSGGVDRFDVSGGITVVYGAHVAKTTGFLASPTNAAYAVGVELTLRDDGDGNAVLDSAASGEFVVALVEAAPTAATAKFANGLLAISTDNAGYFKP